MENKMRSHPLQEVEEKWKSKDKAKTKDAE